MIAVITGDIINSRQVEDSNIWLSPLKIFLKKFGKNPKQWELYRGDSFQLKIAQPAQALHAAISIKAIIKSLKTGHNDQRNPMLDVRLSIGLGNENFSANKITESNGSAYIYSGEQLELLKKTKTNLAVKSDNEAKDSTLNLMLKLGLVVMDNWSLNSAELMKLILEQPQMTQQQLGEKLGIEQNSVSGRFRRAYVSEILELEKHFRSEMKTRSK